LVNRLQPASGAPIGWGKRKPAMRIAASLACALAAWPPSAARARHHAGV